MASTGKPFRQPAWVAAQPSTRKPTSSNKPEIFGRYSPQHTAIPHHHLTTNCLRKQPCQRNQFVHPPNLVTQRALPASPDCVISQTRYAQHAPSADSLYINSNWLHSTPPQHRRSVHPLNPVTLWPRRNRVVGLYNTNGFRHHRQRHSLTSTDCRQRRPQSDCRQLSPAEIVTYPYQPVSRDKPQHNAD